MNRFGNDLFGFQTLLCAIRRQWGKGTLFLVGSLSLVSMAVVFWGNTYRSEARIFVRLGRESISLDPTVSMNGTITVNETREVEINSILEVLQSRDLAAVVVDKLGEETVLSGLPSDQVAEKSGPSILSELLSRIRVLKDGRAITRKERVITSLLRNLNVSSPKKSTVISIQYESDSPEIAQMVVDQVIDGFKTEHVRINRTSGSYEFLREQSQLFKDKLVTAQNSMRDSKNEMGLISIEGHRQTLQDELALLETQRINTKSELAASEAKLVSLQRAIGGLPERQQTEGVMVADDATSGMRDTLYQLQVRERELASKFKEGHPSLKMIQEQTRQAQDIYNSQASEREQTTTGIHPARQMLELTLLTETANFDSLKARFASLEEQYNTTTSRMQKLNADEVLLAELQRTVEHANSSFITYTEKLEQARLDQQLESQRISNVNIIQPASFIEKPAGPNRLLILALGIMFASCGSLGVMMFMDWAARPVFNGKDYHDHEHHLDNLERHSPRRSITRSSEQTSESSFY